MSNFAAVLLVEGTIYQKLLFNTDAERRAFHDGLRTGKRVGYSGATWLMTTLVDVAEAQEEEIIGQEEATEIIDWLATQL